MSSELPPGKISEKIRITEEKCVIRDDEELSSRAHDPRKSPVAGCESRNPKSKIPVDLWTRRSKSSGEEKKKKKEETMSLRRPCSCTPVDSRNIFARLTEALSRRLLVRPTDVGARLLSDLLLAPAFAFFRSDARRPRLILPGTYPFLTVKYLWNYPGEHPGIIEITIGSLLIFSYH